MSTTTSEPFRRTFSFNPSFTPTFPPSPPPSPTSAGFSSIFQSPGGPPLILVCIAAGLLLGAFIGVLLMRRVRPPAPGQRGIGAAAFLAGFNNPPLGEKPRLLDIHLLPAPIQQGVERGTGKEKLAEHGAWGHVSPFAAVYLSDSSPSSDRPRPRTQPAQSPSAAPSWNRSPLSWIAVRLPWADPRLRAGAHELSPLAKASARPEAREVQLVVTVSMPSPQHPSYRPPKLPSSGTDAPYDTDAHHDKHTGEDTMPDCCIGTVVVSYHHDPNDSPAPAPAPVPASAPAPAPAVTS